MWSQQQGLGAPELFCKCHSAFKIREPSSENILAQISFNIPSLLPYLVPSVESVPEEELMTPGHSHKILADLDKGTTFCWRESFGERYQFSRALLGTLFLEKNLIFF